MVLPTGHHSSSLSFGFDALEWKVAENPHAMLWQGLESAMRYYLPTGVIMLVMAVMGWGGTSSYVRWLSILSDLNLTPRSVASHCMGFGCSP
jgi:hypothetical protein